LLFAAGVRGLIASFVGQMVAAFVLAALLVLVAQNLFEGRGGYEATFRVVAYAWAPLVVGWLPLVGSLALVYSAYLMLRGLERVQAQDTTRAALTLVISLAILWILARAGRPLGLSPRGVGADADPGEGQRSEARLGDVGLAALAHAVAAVVDAGERVVDRLEFVAVAVGQDHVDLVVARVAREVVGVHALVLGLLAALVQLRLHVAEELAPHLLQGLADFLQERLAHAGFRLRGAANLSPGRGCVNRNLQAPRREGRRYPRP